MQGGGPPQDRPGDRGQVAQGLYQPRDRDEPDGDRPRGEREPGLVIRELTDLRRRAAHVEAQQACDTMSEGGRELVDETAQVVAPLAARYPERVMARLPPVREEIADREQDDRRTDVVDAVDEVKIERRAHVEDAAEVLPSAGRQREQEPDRDDEVADHGRTAEAPDVTRARVARAPRGGRAEHARGQPETQDERDRAREDDVVAELVAPRLHAR